MTQVDQIVQKRNRSVLLCQVCTGTDDQSSYMGVLADEFICARCGRPSKTYTNIYEPEVQDPRLIMGRGYPPAECISAVELIPWSKPIRWIWDVNGYYKELGVDPESSKREIMLAYLAQEGSNDTRLTYILKQLLDPEIRAEYDDCPSGSSFWDDYAQQDAYRRTLRLMQDHIEVAESAEEVREIVDLVQEGIKRAKSEETQELIDKTFPRDQYVPTYWIWSYYTWKTSSRDYDRLSKWQGELAVHLARCGVKTRFAVGLVDHAAEPWEVRKVGNRIVAFLRNGESPEAWVEPASLAITEQTTLE